MRLGVGWVKIVGRLRLSFWLCAFGSLRVGAVENHRVYALAVKLVVLSVCVAAPPRGGGHFLCCCKESNQRKQLWRLRWGEAVARGTPRMEQPLSVALMPERFLVLP